MKLLEIFRFEFSYQVRRPWTWLFVAVLIALNFLMTRDGSVSDVLYSDFFLNSPFGVAKTTVFGSLIWLVMAAAIAGDAAARDVTVGMHPLLYTSPVGKASYLGGRFLAALVLNALTLLAIPAGILLGVYLPGVHPDLIGPFRPAAFLTAYAFIALPNAFVATAIQFWLATQSGRSMGAYFASFIIVFMGFFIASALLYKNALGTLLDPIGIRFVVEDIALRWTPIEKNSRLLELEGIVLTNRLLWIGIGLIAIAITHVSFRFAHRTDQHWWKRLTQFFSRTANASDTDSSQVSAHLTETVGIIIPHAQRAFGFATQARQMLAIAWSSFGTMATSWAGVALLVVLPLLTIPVVLDQMVSNNVPLVPRTARVIAELTFSFSDELSRWVIIPFLIVFFAGELVWREREAGLSEITDAMPGSAWARFTGKFLGLTLLLTAFLTLQITAGIIAQTILDYHNYQLSLYLKILFGLQLPEYLIFTCLALSVHVIVGQKYIGHLVAIIAFVFIVLSSLFGIEHNLLIYGAGPGWSYTEMRGFGASVGPWLWFKLYWAAWALLFAVIARVLWTRGHETRIAVRLKIAMRNLTRTTLGVLYVSVLLILMTGGFIFYNTNLLHEYYTTAEMKGRSADYERRYRRYAESPQPRVTGTQLQIDIFPDRQAVDIRGTYRLVNRSAVPIDSVHVTIPRSIETIAIEFDRPSVNVMADESLHHNIYTLKNSLAPGDSMNLTFQMHAERHGFRENGVDASLSENGTNFTNAWLPGIGYDESRELLTPGDRRDYGLATRPIIPSLYDVDARKKRGEGTTFEAVLSTSADQIAVAPGALRRSWTVPSGNASTGESQGGRRYFQYVADAPIGGVWDFFSANYKMREVSWKNNSLDPSAKDVSVLIFHDPRHNAHVDRMIASIMACLDFYTKEFGPYPYDHLTVVERPTSGAGMHAEPAMITHGEGFTSWNPNDNPGSHDHPYAIVAHEMAHQWPVAAAVVEGAPVMSESLAWYFGMKLVEHTKGPEALGLLLNYMHQPHPYPAIRRGEPLMRALDTYLSYRRGPFALYALSEYIGEERVNHALRVLREKHRSKNAPLATTLDLYRELNAVTPDSMSYLLHDMFEVNTYWSLEMVKATAKKIGDGNWEVKLDVNASKSVYDSAGVESGVPMDEWIEVGVFGGVRDREQQERLSFRKHRIRSGRQTLILHVSQKPSRVGIDPRNLLIDLNIDNNTKHLEVDSPVKGTSS